MPHSKYIYNPKTVRYERAKISILSIVMTTAGILLMGAVFFVGLVYLQNYIIETPLERSLKAENAALNHYQVELAANLLSVKAQMEELESKDKTLYEKIFETPKAVAQVLDYVQPDKKILLADIPAFHEAAGFMLDKFTNLNATARIRSNYFAEAASISKEDIQFLTAVPSFAPVADFDAVRLVSGFGMRINPFHKRNYHHDGIDIAGPRGSEVLAAAPGRVTLVSFSDLQAGFGNYIEIDHGHGYVTRYANLGETTARYGQSIKKGQPIGLIGISGGSVAPHIHYEVLKDGKNLDPVKFLIQGLDATQFEQIWQAGTKQNQSLD